MVELKSNIGIMYGNLKWIESDKPQIQNIDDETLTEAILIIEDKLIKFYE